MDEYIEVPLRIYDENKENRNLDDIASLFKKKIHRLVDDKKKKELVYRITSRVKSRDNLIRKIQALYRRDELNELTDDEVFFRVTDVIGIRIVCRFIDKLKEIDEVIRKSNAFKIKENKDNPLVEAYVIDKDDIKYLYKGQTRIEEIKYLFSLEPECRRYLKEGHIVDELRKAFEEHNHLLAINTQIFKRDGEWIVRVDGADRYRVEDTDKELKIYNITTWVYDIESDKKIFEMKIKPMRYASVHYLVEPIESFKIDAIDNLVKSGLLVEIQLRSLFQECWAELEHEVSYKVYSEKKDEFKTLSEILHPLDKYTMSIRDRILAEAGEKRFEIFRDRINTRFPDIFEYVPKEMDDFQKSLLDQNNGFDHSWLSNKLDAIKRLPPLYLYLLAIDGDLKIPIKCLKKYKEFAIDEKSEDECIGDIKFILIKNFFENIKRRRPDQYKKLIHDYTLDEDSYKTIIIYLMCWSKCVDTLIEYGIFEELESFLKKVWQFILHDKKSSLVLPKLVPIIFKAWRHVNKKEWTNMIEDFLKNYDIAFTNQTIVSVIESISQTSVDARDEYMLAIVDTVRKAASTWNDQGSREDIQAIIKQSEQGKHPNTIDAK